MAELECAADRESVAATLTANGLGLPAGADDLVELLSCEPRLSGVIARLVHFEPAAAWRSAGAEVAWVDHGS